MVQNASLYIIRLRQMKKDFNKHQTALIKEFISTTSGSEKQAISFLERAKWNIQNAINIYFDEGTEPEVQQVTSNSKIDQLFELYSSASIKNPDLRLMDEENFSDFNKKYLHIDDENVVLGHILMNVMEVETSGHIEKTHFIRLFNYLKCTNPEELYKLVPKLEKELKESKQLYKATFSKLYKFYLVGTKEVSLNYDLAEQLWRVYLKPVMPLYKVFIEYLGQLPKKPHKVHLDLWNMIYEFATTVSDISDVKQSDGWPVFIDDFVDYIRSK